jgi:hypothetical protein
MTAWIIINNANWHTENSCVPALLAYRYHELDITTWGDPLFWSVGVLFSICIAALLTWCGTYLGLLASRSWLRLSWGRDAASPSRFRQVAWLVALARHPPSLKSCMIVGFAVGIGIAGLGVVTTLVTYFVREYVQSPLPPFRQTMPSPVLHAFAVIDLAGLFVLPAIIFTLMLVLPARKVSTSEQRFTRRWCSHCGYRLLGSWKEAQTSEKTQCPECGKFTSRSPSRTSRAVS